MKNSSKFYLPLCLGLGILLSGCGAPTQPSAPPIGTEVVPSQSPAIDVTEKSPLPVVSQSVHPDTPDEPAVEVPAATDWPSMESSDFIQDILPAYAGAPYVTLADEPYFTEAEKNVTESYEYYSDLDYLGRCGYAMANIGLDLMPTEERGEIGSVKPTGWHTVKYDCVDGKYLYNRCHLIGFQLTGENANPQNLTTGTRSMNVDGMLPFENLVADYVHETGNHVLYRVTPIFQNSNLVADGVLMEGWSIEDQGDGICFNIFAYNTQPGVTIDYTTGDSWSDYTCADYNPVETPVPNQEMQHFDASNARYIGNMNTMKFHLPTCSSVEDMNESNKFYFDGSREDMINMGYVPCKRCSP